MSDAKVKRIRLRDSLVKKLEGLDDVRDGAKVGKAGVTWALYESMDVSTLREQLFHRASRHTRAGKPFLITELRKLDEVTPRGSLP